MQQLEFAQMQQREANRAALEALGPRKKRPLDSSISFSGLEVCNIMLFSLLPYLHQLTLVSIFVKDIVCSRNSFIVNILSVS